MFPKTHVLNSWSPAVLLFWRLQSLIEVQAWCRKVGHWGWALKMILPIQAHGPHILVSIVGEASVAHCCPMNSAMLPFWRTEAVLTRWSQQISSVSSKSNKYSEKINKPSCLTLSLCSFRYWGAGMTESQQEPLTLGHYGRHVFN